jgi:hypothetical protein
MHAPLNAYVTNLSNERAHEAIPARRFWSDACGGGDAAKDSDLLTYAPGDRGQPPTSRPTVPTLGRLQLLPHESLCGI